MKPCIRNSRVSDIFAYSILAFFICPVASATIPEPEPYHETELIDVEKIFRPVESISFWRFSCFCYERANTQFESIHCICCNRFYCLIRLQFFLYHYCRIVFLVKSFYINQSDRNSWFFNRSNCLKRTNRNHIDFESEFEKATRKQKKTQTRQWRGSEKPKEINKEDNVLLKNKNHGE